MTNQDKKNLIFLSNRFMVTVKKFEVKFVEICSRTKHGLTLQDKNQMLGHAYFHADAQSLARIGQTPEQFSEWLTKNGATKRKREKRTPYVSYYD